MLFMYHLFQSSSKMPLFKAWNEDASKKKLIKASTIEELLQKGMFQKLMDIFLYFFQSLWSTNNCAWLGILQFRMRVLRELLLCNYSCVVLISYLSDLNTPTFEHNSGIS